jgi:hypothetical protein
MSKFIDLGNNLANQGVGLNVKSNSILNICPDSEDGKDLIAGLAVKVKAEINIYKTMMNPLTNELTAIINKGINEYNKSNSIKDYIINRIQIPSIYDLVKNNGYVVETEMMQSFGNQSVIIGTQTIDQIKQHFQFDSQVVSEEVKDFTLDWNDSDYIAFWEKYFKTISSNNVSIIGASDDVNNLEELCMVSLIISKIKSETPGTVRVSGSTYEHIMNKYRAIVSKSIENIIAKIEGYGRHGILIVKSDKRNKVIHVVNEVYKKFVEQTGKPEMLLGILTAPDNKKYSNISDVISSGDTLIKYWNNEVKRANIVTSSNKINIIQDIYRVNEEELVENIKAYAKDILPEDIDIKKILRKAVSDNKNDLLTPKEFFISLIDVYLIPDSNFALFRKNMMNHMKAHSGITEKEAASFATLDLVNNYLLQQVEVTVNG